MFYKESFLTQLRHIVPECEYSYRDIDGNYIVDQNGVIITTSRLDYATTMKDLIDYKLQYDLLKGRRKVCL